MNLDTLTMVVMIFITSLVMATFTLITGFNQSLPGLKRFTSVLLGNSVIYLMVYLKLHFEIDQFLYVVVINTTISSMHALLLYAIAVFRRDRFPTSFYLVPVALTIFLSIVLMDDDAMRKLAIDVILLVQNCLILWQLLRSGRLGSGRHLMIAVTVSLIANMAYRAIVAISGRVAEPVSASDPMYAVTYLIMFMTSVLLSLGFLLASFEQERSRLQQIQERETLRHEREKFSRELHDGLGGHLAALSSMIGDGIDNRQMFSETIDQALLDMRLIMDGLGEECLDVGMTLGMLRQRLQSRLQILGIEAVWQMERLPVGCLLAEGGSLHLMRILQEALTNVARHSGADRVEIHAAAVAEAGQMRVRITVTDNGRGLGDGRNHGNGITNMKKRAQTLGGAMQIDNHSEGGTALTITCPVTIGA